VTSADGLISTSLLDFKYFLDEIDGCGVALIGIVAWMSREGIMCLFIVVKIIFITKFY
jgi:hypothetical protein